MDTPREIIDHLLWATADLSLGHRVYENATVRVALEYGPKVVFPDEEYAKLRRKGTIMRQPGKLEVWARARHRPCGLLRDALGGPLPNLWRRCNTAHFWAYYMPISTET